MPETDLDTANTKISEWEAKFSTQTTELSTLGDKFKELTDTHETVTKQHGELSIAVESRDVEIAKFKDSTKNHDAAITALQAKLTEAEGKAGSDPELKTKFDTLTTEHDALKTSVSDSSKIRLKTQGLSDELLKDKSQSELNAMEAAILVAKPGGAGTDTKGLGLGSGGGSVPGGTTAIDADLEQIKAAKRRAGVPV